MFDITGIPLNETPPSNFYLFLSISHLFLQKLFSKKGELAVCKFDRDDFGNFLGSATVTYKKADDAKQAIHEYNGAFLDDKVLTVEYDVVPSHTRVLDNSP